jgi:3-oxosteroid 1-dehydrogenase
MADWDHSVDLLVVGSGAGAMAAGIRGKDLGLDVLLVEKSDTYGGSSAMSGGVTWVGANRNMKKYGISDSKEETLRYLKHITKGEVADEYLKTYVEESVRMVDYFAEKTHLVYDSLDQYTDYYPEAPGGKMGGRSMEPMPFDGSKLGDDFKDMQRPAYSALIMGKFMITARIAKKMIMLGFPAMLHMAFLFFLYFLRYPKRKALGRDPYLTNGNALIGRLRLSLKDRDVPLWLSTPAKELVTQDGKVIGAVVEKDGKPFRIQAKKGVLIAAGGFDRNLQMREKYGPAPANITWTAGKDTNTGDGIQMGMNAGADVGLMDDAWWTPVTQYPRVQTGWVLVVEKSLPGGIFVNQEGKRYTNEAAPYVDCALAQYRDHQKTGKSVPGWMVFDGRYRRQYIAGPMGPGKVTPDKALPGRVRREFMKKSDTVAGLAEQIGVPAENLEATFARYNEMALKGKDEDFGRGESAQDRYYGDDRVKPNPCMAPLTQPPFYAIPLFPGDLGTKGGLKTDTSGHVLRADGSVIEGLYATGNSMCSIMGRTYPGAGGTIGPSMLFGFLSAEAAAEVSSNRSSEDKAEASPVLGYAGSA